MEWRYNQIKVAKVSDKMQHKIVYFLESKL